MDILDIDHEQTIEKFDIENKLIKQGLDEGDYIIVEDEDFDEDYDPMRAALTSAINQTGYLLELNDSVEKLEKLADQRKHLKGLGIPDIEIDNEIERLEVRYRIGRLNSDKQPESTFETVLSDERGIEICNEIITNKGSRAGKGGHDNRLFVEVTEKHRSTLMYLLGGARPGEVVPIRYVNQGNIFLLLQSITDVEGVGKDKGNKVVPNFMRKVICPEILRDRNGNRFKEIKQ